LVDDIVKTAVQPTVDEMQRRGTPFVGLLYAGLALTSRGLRVVEFNARFGDPETQVVLARLLTPLGGVLKAAATGQLDRVPDLRWTPDAAVTVVIAAHGYPNRPKSGDPITGLDAANAVDGAYVLHAGTTLVDGDVVSAGGRVLSVVGTGTDLQRARHIAYDATRMIKLEGSHFRNDIAARAASKP
jgi:phosphoribosylamine--glycine ligase